MYSYIKYWFYNISTFLSLVMRETADCWPKRMKILLLFFFSFSFDKIELKEKKRSAERLPTNGQEQMRMYLYDHFSMVPLDYIHIKDKSSAYTALFAIANSLALYVVGPNVLYAQCSMFIYSSFFSYKKKLLLFPLAPFFWPNDICVCVCVSVRCASTQNPNIVSNQDRFFCLNNRKQKKTCNFIS